MVPPSVWPDDAQYEELKRRAAQFDRQRLAKLASLDEAVGALASIINRLERDWYNLTKRVEKIESRLGIPHPGPTTKDAAAMMQRPTLEARQDKPMTRDEYFAQDIIARLEYAVSTLVGDIEPPSEGGYRDPLVFLDSGIGINVSDVIHDAIIEIKRLRKEHLR
jgi:hypothetical protein